MKQDTLSQLVTMLHKLKRSEGYFTIQSQNTGTGKNKGPAFFCQLLNPGDQEPIRFEAVSHHFNDLINKDIESNFKSLGFQLENGENYTKFIKLDSESAIDNIISEIRKIFEEFYGVGVDSEYRFEEEIDS